MNSGWSSDQVAPSPASTPCRDRKSTRLNSSHRCISYAVFCLKKKKNETQIGNGHLMVTKLTGKHDMNARKKDTENLNLPAIMVCARPADVNRYNALSQSNNSH